MWKRRAYAPFPMSRGESWGRYVALAALALMWPAVVAYLRGTVQGTAAAAFGVAAVLYCVIYIWYCLVGFRLRALPISSAVVGSLSVLAVVLDHVSGQISFNYFLIPLLVAG